MADSIDKKVEQIIERLERRQQVITELTKQDEEASEVSS